MTHPLDPLDRSFLDTLGRQGTLDQFMRFLEPSEPKTQEAGRRLRWQSGASAEQRTADGPGVLLGFQRIEPNASPDRVQWGLHSLMLHSALSSLSPTAWTHAWPANLPAEKTTLHDVSAVFGKPEVAMQGLAIFALKGPQGQSWGMQCQFDEGGHLQTFTVVHLDKWLPLPEAKPDPATTVNATPPITCNTGSIVPKTGWYEGMLPQWHPNHANFNRAEERFVYCEQGQRMSRLGVKPHTYEGLVVWTWRGERIPR
ncbi:MAG: hypothetical protein FWD69_16315 [Polyangiaceae bacterium]|nr:hypothetical protein [Polyangiaceae bacterium]